MSKNKELDPSLIVAEVFQRHPETISVFVRNRMACTGCPMSPFESLGDVMRAYGLNPSLFLGQLRKAIQLGRDKKDSDRADPRQR